MLSSETDRGTQGNKQAEGRNCQRRKRYFASAQSIERSRKRFGKNRSLTFSQRRSVNMVATIPKNILVFC